MIRQQESPDAQNALAPDHDAELDREQRWHWFEADVRAFAEAEPDGYAAVLRAVARAMKNQRELLDA